MDTEYLKASVGTALSTSIAETVLMRPEDPVDYLAQRLLKFVEDANAKKVALKEEETAKADAAKAATVEDVRTREKENKAKAKETQVAKEDDKLAKLFDKL